MTKVFLVLRNYLCIATFFLGAAPGALANLFPVEIFHSRNVDHIVELALSDRDFRPKTHDDIALYQYNQRLFVISPIWKELRLRPLATRLQLVRGGPLFYLKESFFNLYLDSSLRLQAHRRCLVELSPEQYQLISALNKIFKQLLDGEISEIPAPLGLQLQSMNYRNTFPVLNLVRSYTLVLDAVALSAGEFTEQSLTGREPGNYDLARIAKVTSVNHLLEICADMKGMIPYPQQTVATFLRQPPTFVDQDQPFFLPTFNALGVLTTGRAISMGILVCELSMSFSRELAHGFRLPSVMLDHDLYFHNSKILKLFTETRIEKNTLTHVYEHANEFFVWLSERYNKAAKNEFGSELNQVLLMEAFVFALHHESPYSMAVMEKDSINRALLDNILAGRWHGTSSDSIVEEGRIKRKFYPTIVHQVADLIGMSIPITQEHRVRSERYQNVRFDEEDLLQVVSQYSRFFGLDYNLIQEDEIIPGAFNDNNAPQDQIDFRFPFAPALRASFEGAHSNL